MATIPDPDRLDIEEQIARIQKMNHELAKGVVETVKIAAETRKLLIETQYLPRTVTFQALIAAAALLGAGAALAKLFFP